MTKVASKPSTPPSSASDEKWRSSNQQSKVCFLPTWRCAVLYLPIHPPSTTSTCPETYALDLLAKYTTLPLKSSGTPHRPAGILSLMLFSRFSSASKAVFISVAMYLVRSQHTLSSPNLRTYPGAIALTVTPFEVHSFDSALVSCVTAPFDAAYAGTVNPPWKDSKLAKFMILPRRPVTGEGSSVSICAPTSRQIVKTVVRLT